MSKKSSGNPAKQCSSAVYGGDIKRVVLSALSGAFFRYKCKVTKGRVAVPYTLKILALPRLILGEFN